METVSFILVGICTYLLGSVPTGFLVGKARGVDIRQVGSGNIGATNTLRVLGKPAGVFVLLMDALKGFAACTLLVLLVTLLLGTADTMGAGSVEALRILAGCCAVVGHNYTCWLGFRGGKGIATSAGVLLAWVPQAFLISLLVWSLALAITRYVSLASICVAVVLPFAVWLTQASTAMILVAVGLSVLAILRHRTNIIRLLNGTEHRLGSRRTATGS